MLTRALYRLAGRLPCRLIKVNDKPYLERYYLGSWLGCTAYLHRFVSGDDERHVHDHPWNKAVAIVLAGRYIEERVTWLCPSYGWMDTLRAMRPGRINIIRGRDFHRVTRPKPETWTLFMHGPRIKGWGFLSRSAPGAVLYHQPFDTEASIGWYLRAPIGRESNREPYGATHEPAQ
jgi:hypothetical protein